MLFGRFLYIQIDFKVCTLILPMNDFLFGIFRNNEGKLMYGFCCFQYNFTHLVSFALLKQIYFILTKVTTLMTTLKPFTISF